MTKTARSARSAAVIKLLCDRFPKTFSRHDPRPLKVGVYVELLAALGSALEPRDLKSALPAYTSNARYLRALTTGACRIGLDGKPAGTVTPEDEAVAKATLAEAEKATTARAKVARAKGPEPAARTPTAENPNPRAPKRLSLADLREAGRRRREAAA
jgi:ProP effector